VPTTIPAAPKWPLRKPWIMTSADQFRPGPPPDLKSELWARDYNEIRALGAKNSSRRTAEQTEIARFWETTAPTIYFPVVRSVANAPEREVTQNARLLAVTAQAMDDALIAILDAKYHYNFWRPMQALRNGDMHLGRRLSIRQCTRNIPALTAFMPRPSARFSRPRSARGRCLS